MNNVHPIEHPRGPVLPVGQSIPLESGGVLEVFTGNDGGYLRLEQSGRCEWWIIPSKRPTP